MRTNVAVVLAGGVGARLGATVPKQFMQISGRYIIEYTIDAFDRHEEISEIVVVIHEDWRQKIEELIEYNGWKKVNKILNGGKERYESSLVAIREYSGQDVNLIFHDAVRPFISQRIITDVCTAMKEYQAIDVTVPCTDTIVEIDGEFLKQIPDRSRLNRGQTPQAFHIDLIEDAYRLALQDPAFKVSDDCGVVCRYRPDIPVYIVRGEERNMKLTYPEDLIQLEAIYKRNEVL